MQPSEISRAMAAALSIATAAGLAARDAVVLQNSNKLSLRLMPCDVFARVAPQDQHVAPFEIDLAQRLARTNSPVAALEPRVAPRAYEHDGFVVTLWTYYDPATARAVTLAGYAKALERLHAGMRTLDIKSPHYTDRVAEAQELVANRDQTPSLAGDDRALLSDLLKDLRQSIADRGAAEQLLHGEPHPGNVLGTRGEPVFIDLETCCRGPIEFDLAHAPAVVADHYPGLDLDLLGQCRGLVLAMVTAWRWDAGDQFPNGRRVGIELVRTLREGPPWPTLDAMMRRVADPSPVTTGPPP